MDINFSEDDLRNAINKLDIDTGKVLKIISKFQTDELSDKRSQELWHVGKFLSHLGENVKIVCHRDKPDFIISYEGRSSGLEHQRILKQSVSDSKAIEKLISEAADVFKSNHPEINFTAAIYWANLNFQFKKSDSERMKLEIADYVYQVYNKIGVEDAHSSAHIIESPGLLNIAKPEYLEKVHLTQSDALDLYYNAGGYVISNIGQQTLNEEIARKEPLVNSYKSESHLSEQWLLLVLITTSPHSFHFPADGRFSITTSFDKVFVLEDFDNKVYEIK